MSYNQDKRAWRVSVYKDTTAVAKKYRVEPSVKTCYDSRLVFEKAYESTPIVITNEDTLYAGARLVAAGHTPLLLNFACERNPGGGVETGAGAQEESLFRRTNLCLTLQHTMYPILDHEGIYTPCATVFRESEDAQCAYLKTPWSVAFSTVPGLRRPQLQNGRLTSHDVNRLIKKIHIICQMGAQNGHDVLVLGALGCGAWMNPPAQVATIFRDVLKSYDGVFKEIVFAIYDRAGSDNYAAFTQVFSDPL
jgi:uncharacterized protein (TIGR02452 family)